MNRLSLTQLRQDLSRAIARARDGERILIHHRGRDLAVLVPHADCRFLETLEDRLDVAMARAVLKRTRRSTDYGRVRAQLKLGPSSYRAVRKV